VEIGLGLYDAIIDTSDLGVLGLYTIVVLSNFASSGRNKVIYESCVIIKLDFNPPTEVPFPQNIVKLCIPPVEFCVAILKLENRTVPFAKGTALSSNQIPPSGLYIVKFAKV
ncbi:unnamed protein product, partial [marine sediment metagenome]